MNLKEIIIELLEEYEKGKYSNIILNDFFRKNKLQSKEKGFITEIFYGVIRNLIFLDYQMAKRTKKVKKSYLKQLLRISFYQIAFMESDNKSVVWEAVELSKKYGDMSNFINGVLRKYLLEYEKDIETLEKSDWGVRYSYPEWFIKKLKSQYGKRTLELMKSFKEIPYLSVRINKFKMSEEEFLRFIESKNIKIVNRVEDIFYLSKSIIDTKEFEEGKVIVQDGSSYLAAKLLGAKENEKILDTCSAPGSKSLVIAEEMNDKGIVFSLDIFEHKLKLIKENSEKMGINIINPILQDARKIDELNDDFDRILVDAPCSGFGVIRKKPEAIYKRNMDNILELANLQREILSSASKKLKVGGHLVYSTCTIFGEENTKNIEKFLEENKDFEVEGINLPSNVESIKDNLGGLTILDKYLDGFYIIKLKKKS